MESDKEIALYHPYVDIDDGSFIKTAALYWDELQTIVPQSIDNPYNAPVSREAQKEGFLKPRIIRSSSRILDKAGNEFVNDIQNKDVQEKIVDLSNIKRKDFFEINYEKLLPVTFIVSRQEKWHSMRHDVSRGLQVFSCMQENT